MGRSFIVLKVCDSNQHVESIQLKYSSYGKEGSVLFNDAFNTFSYGYMASLNKTFPYFL